MSIRPEFANAILSGEKAVEFRKRPIADDVSHILIYATMPVGALLGWFAVRGQRTMSPKGLWSTFRAVGGISETRFFDYYATHEQGTGILVEAAGRFPVPFPLTDLGASLRPPQSFQYLTAAQVDTFLMMAGNQPYIESGTKLCPPVSAGCDSGPVGRSDASNAT